jgi:flagellar biosynthesis protein FliQ
VGKIAHRLKTTRNASGDFAHAPGSGTAMSGPEVLDVARDAILTLVLVASPLMLVGLLVGVAISLLQALTQIQEMTLAFVPKILAIFVAMMIALPFMADLLHAHMLRIAARIAGG